MINSTPLPSIPKDASQEQQAFYDGILKILRDLRQEGSTDLSNKVNTDDLLDIMYPIGSFYVQYPDAESSTLAIAFPDTYAPATLFGGTWVKQFDDEGICFYTEPKAGDTEQTRTDGLQEDQVEKHAHGNSLSYRNAAGSDGYRPSFTANDGSLSFNDGVTAKITGMKDDTYTVRYGSTTKGRNRLVRIWKRTG